MPLSRTAAPTLRSLPVNGGGVDVAVACGDGLFDCADGHFAVRGAERAETDARNFDAVTQFESILK